MIIVDHCEEMFGINKITTIFDIVLFNGTLFNTLGVVRFTVLKTHLFSLQNSFNYDWYFFNKRT